MNLPAVLFALRCLVRDTFSQAASSGLLALLLVVTGVSVALCLSVGLSAGIPFRPGDDRDRLELLPPDDPQAKNRAKLEREGVAVIRGEVTLLGGAVRVPVTNLTRDDIVHFLQLLLAGGVADAAGLLLALVWTAGFLPGFLEPHSVSVLLVKPVPRWALLVGKYLGVLAFLAVQVSVFILGTWLALGLATGVFNATYLLAVPLLLVHFAIFFSVSAWLAVRTHSTVLCVGGTVVFWLACWAVNYAHHALLLATPNAGIGGVGAFLLEAGYWVLPKPMDLCQILFEALEAKKHFGSGATFEAFLTSPSLPVLSVVASALFSVGVLAAAARSFAKADY